MKTFIVEIADEEDGFAVIDAETPEEAESIAKSLGYEVMYAHEEDE